jgi:hypothetical protein
MADRYQSNGKWSTNKFEVMGRNEVAVRLPLPLVEVWEELEPEVEHLTGLAGLKIIRAVIEDEVIILPAALFSSPSLSQNSRPPT